VYEFLDFHASDVMSEPVSVGPDATLADAERILEERGFNGLPVVADGALVGFVTSLDLLEAFAFSTDSILPPYDEIMRRPVSTVMAREPATVQLRTPLTRVLQKMVETRNKSFPVVDADDRLVGVVAREDVIRALRRAQAGERPAPRSSEGTARKAQADRDPLEAFAAGTSEEPIR
jgi:CBS domain-containing protein